MEVKVTTTLPELRDQMISASVEMRRRVKLQIFRALTLLEKEIKKNIRLVLKRRTGALLNSVTKEVHDDMSGSVGVSGVPYGAIHEFGGTITPKNAQSLAIPLEENRRADGTPKVSLKELFGGLGSRVFVTKNGVVMLASDGGKKGAKFTKLTPMFVFKKSVNIPARPYVRPALEANRDRILKEFGLFLSASFDKKSGGTE